MRQHELRSLTGIAYNLNRDRVVFATQDGHDSGQTVHQPS